MNIRFLLDENVHPLYRIELLKRERALSVWQIGILGAPPKGTLDPDVLDWCETRDFLLVTNNRHSMPIHLRDHLNQGKHVPGIFVMNPGMSAGDTINELLLIWGTAKQDEYQDRITYLPVSS